MAVVAFVLLVVVPYQRLRRQALADFRRARGTQHREVVGDAIAKVDAKAASLRVEISRSVTSRVAIDQEERTELDEALARYLVRTRLVEVPGIGAANVRAIETTLLRHSLADLHRAAGHVPGIGPAKQAAITTWVNAMGSDWSALQNAAFPGKQDIQLRYQARRVTLTDRERVLSQRVSQLEELSRTASAALAVLGTPSVDDFTAALRGRQPKPGHPQLGAYIAGLFAPWAVAPPWFNELLSSAQQADQIGHAG